MNFEINTYWNVEVTYQILNGVSSIMQSGNFVGLMKLAFLIMCLISLITFMWNKDMGFFRWFFQALLFTMLINMPIGKVVLTDNLAQQPPKIVQNVPWLLAAGSAFINNASGWLVKSYETVFNIPDALSLTGTGDMGYGQALIKHANKVTITDPVLRSDVMQFFKECTIYDIQDGYVSASDLSNRADSWNYVLSNTNPARFVTFGSLGANRVTRTCTDAANDLRTRVQNGLEASMRYYGKSFFNRFPDDIAYSMYLNSLGTSYSWLLNSNQSASDAVKQSMFNNVWREAGTELPALMNDPSRVAEITANAGAALGAKQVQGNMSVVTKFAYEVIPQIRNWLEAIMYSIFPIVLIILILSKADNMLGVLGTYFSSLIALGIIPIFFAVINHISLIYLKMKADALELAAGVPFGMMGVLDGTLIDEQTMVGYMVILSIFLAGWLAFKMQGSITGVGQRMLMSWSAAGSAGSSLSTGNANIGEQTIDNISANNTNMHKMDTSELYNNNGRSYVGSDATRTIYNNGDVATQYHNNDLHYGASVNSGISRNVGSERSSDTTLSKGQNFDTNSTLGSTYSYDETKGQGRTNLQSIGVNRAEGVSGSDNRGFDNNLGYGVNASNNNSYNEDRRFDQSLNGGMSGSLGLSVPGGGSSGGGSINPNTGQPGASSQGIPGAPGSTGGAPNGKGGVPGGQGNNAVPGSNAAPGKGGRGGLPAYGNLGAQGGIDFRYSEGAQVGNGAEVRLQGDQQQGINQHISHDRNGSLTDTNESQRQSNQQWGIQENASVFNNNQVITGESASINQQEGTRETAGLNYSRSLNFDTDYGRSVTHASDVARENNMSPGQFSLLSPKEQQALSQEYLIKQEANSLKMPTQFLNGDGIKNNKELFVSFDQYKNEIADRYGFDQKAQANLDKVGVGQNDVAALNPNLSTPSIVRDAQATVADRAQELGAKEKDLREGAKKKTDYEQDLEPNSKITRILQDKLGTFGGGDTPKK
ncbi:conjugal transfer protein TraG N-terminal domain-containing protein [Acinetobacter gerneri]|uniref:conjugal transfer protein TraG N-terminal domain-containing protein n=2 Tax=Bacteria TaxID=2 RepID=UPI0029368A6E|nr:conjugal transfer protein TraG N-terminal domain-containing protein [Acinetobacter gerneri]MDV2441455.1 conjugal transfer protein TraG N-terminal domain-containing protein [Acinetobacter gerneri]